MFTALTLHLFYVKKSFVVFLRVSQRAFWPNQFLCYLALFSAIQKVFSVVFYASPFFVLQQGPSARDRSLL